MPPAEVIPLPPNAREGSLGVVMVEQIIPSVDKYDPSGSHDLSLVGDVEESIDLLFCEKNGNAFQSHKSEQAEPMAVVRPPPTEAKGISRGPEVRFCREGFGSTLWIAPIYAPVDYERLKPFVLLSATIVNHQPRSRSHLVPIPHITNPLKGRFAC